jgi:hypothetical protein
VEITGGISTIAVLNGIEAIPERDLLNTPFGLSTARRYYYRPTITQVKAIMLE